MAALQDRIDEFINKAQVKIGVLGTSMAKRENDGDLDCIDSDIFLIEELQAAIGLLQCCCSGEGLDHSTETVLDVDGSEELDNDGSTMLEDVITTSSSEGQGCCGDDILAENEKYKIMSYLIYKADLDLIALHPYGSICLTNNIVKANPAALSVPVHNRLLGLQGGDTSGNYYHLDEIGYNKVVNLPDVSGAIEELNFTTDGVATEYVLTHTLNTTKLIKEVINLSLSNECEYPTVNFISNNQVKVSFTYPPNNGTAYSVVLFGKISVTVPDPS
jgi:hypothetical protein